MLCDVQALALRSFSAFSLPCWNSALRPYEEARSNLLENDSPPEVETNFSS